MKIVAVTAYVPIAGHPRSPEQYEELLAQLFDVEIPLVCLGGELEQCWLFRHLRERGQTFTHSVSDNPVKNSVAYHCVQAEKSEWLTMVAHLADVLVWIDAGIFHLRGVTAQLIRDFMRRAQSERAIAIPGCWGRDYVYDDKHPVWRFCGGVWIVPQKYAGALDAAMKQEYRRWLMLTGNLSWEVNTLSRVERRYPDLPIWHYHADHDASIFSAYPETRGSGELPL